eukprot:TRINITY_DN1534_c1_g1_i1.p1 TRINITY_DN1534_c1_g1~~TRINITY_DN1534_c1_g1_i1.p1  ORF type:complete len:279 (-),score=62.22 TRINITY_DN1534_c1_g1_i1:33-824(-)
MANSNDAKCERDDRRGCQGLETQGPVSAEILLSLPFDEALRRCPALMQYIQTSGNVDGDVHEVMNDFRENWHSGAPRELWVVLEEILQPERADVAESEELDEEIGAARIESVGISEKIQLRTVPNGSHDDGSQRLDSSTIVGRQFDQGADRRRDVEAYDEKETEDETEDPRIETLLALPFREALQRCPELAMYLEAQEAPDEVRAEFEQHWSEEAPTELRDVLLEVLHPEVAAVNSAAVEEFRQRMGEHVDWSLPASEPKSRL